MNTKQYFIVKNLHKLNLYNTSVIFKLNTVQNIPFFQKYCSIPFTTIESQQDYFKKLEIDLNIKSYEDWYNVPILKIPKKLYSKYNSMFSLLQHIYPQYIWLPWKFHIAPKGCWNFFQKGKLNRRQYLSFTAKNFSLKFQTDWYKMSVVKLNQEKGPSFLKNIYSNNLSHCLIDLFPEIQFIPWYFSKTSQGYWTALENQRKYINSLESKLNINSIEDWYKIPVCNINSTVYKRYNSMYLLLKNIFPNYIWEPWKFENTLISCWEIKYNRRQRLNIIAMKMNIKTLKNWYQISFQKIYKNNNGTFLNKIYKSNLGLALSDLYPEYEWFFWKFERIPFKFWDSSFEVKKFLNWFEIKNNIKDKKDWYFITHNQISILGGGSLLLNYNGLPNLLLKFFPENDWDLKKFKYFEKLK